MRQFIDKGRKLNRLFLVITAQKPAVAFCRRQSGTDRNRPGTMEKEEVAMGLIFVDQKRYAQLLSKALPRVIQTEQENEQCIAFLESLQNKERLSPKEQQLSELLIVLIEKFEERYDLQSGAAPLDMVRFLMESNGLRQADMLDVFGTRSVASEVLNGKRDLSKIHIERLSAKFHISPEVFFGHAGAGVIPVRTVRSVSRTGKKTNVPSPAKAKLPVRR